MSARSGSLLVDREMPYVGVTPDGIVLNNAGSCEPIEVKATFKYKDEEDIQKLWQKLPYLTCRNCCGKKWRSTCQCSGVQATLNVSHPYYRQCQLECGIMSANICHFYVIGGEQNKGLYIPVRFDEKAFKKTKALIQRFYLTHFFDYVLNQTWR